MPLSGAERSRRKRDKARQQRIAEQHQAAQSDSQVRILPTTSTLTPSSNLDYIPAASSASNSILPTLPSFDPTTLPHHRYPTRHRHDRLPPPVERPDIATQLSNLYIEPTSPSYKATQPDPAANSHNQSNTDHVDTTQPEIIVAYPPYSPAYPDTHPLSREAGETEEQEASYSEYNEQDSDSSAEQSGLGIIYEPPTTDQQSNSSNFSYSDLTDEAYWDSSSSENATAEEDADRALPAEPQAIPQYDWLGWRFPTPPNNELSITRRQIICMHRHACSCKKQSYTTGTTLSQMTDYITKNTTTQYNHQLLEYDLENIQKSRTRIRLHEVPFQHTLSSSNKTELSFQATEDSLRDLQKQLCITRSYDIDSYIIYLRSLSAFPNQGFSLSYLPNFSSTIAQNTYCSFMSVVPHKTHNILLGSFGGSRRNTVHIVFPNSPPILKYQTAYLPFDKQEEFVNNYVLPSLRYSCPPIILTQHPTSFAQAKAKASTWRGKRDIHHTALYTHLKYDIPCEYTAQFWEHLEKLCNQDPSSYFARPILLLQEHGIKDLTVGNSPEEALRKFYSKYLSTMDPDQLYPDATWVDFAFRDVPSLVGPINPHNNATPSLTLLYKTDCLTDISRCAGNTFRGFRVQPYSVHLFRDVGGLEMHKPYSGAQSRKPALCHAKAYNIHKQHRWTPHKDWRPFDVPQFGLMALGPDLMQTYYKSEANASTRRGQPPKPSHLFHEFQIHKMQLYNMLSPPSGSCPPYMYGTRCEYRLLWSHITTAVDFSTPLFAQTVRPFLPVDNNTHNPFFLLPTQHLNDLVLACAIRFIQPIEKLAIFALPNPSMPGEQFDPDRRAEHLYTNQLLIRLLRMTCDNGRPSELSWIWKHKVNHLVGKGRRRQCRGLGIQEVVEKYGMVWLPDDMFEWHIPRLTSDICRQVRIFFPRLNHGLKRPRQGVTRNAVETDALFKTILQDNLECILEHATTPGQHRQAQLLRNETFKLALQVVAWAYHSEFLKAHEPFVQRIGLPRKSLDAVLYGDPQDRARCQFDILTPLELYKIHIRVLAMLGPKEIAQLLDQGYPPFERSRLPVPIFAQQRRPKKLADGSDYDADGCRPWSVYVQSMLSGMDGTASWVAKSFVSQYTEVENAWRAMFTGQEISCLSPNDWSDYCRAYAGSYIFVTPSFERTKFLYVQTSRRGGDTRYDLFGIAYCCPGLSRRRIEDLGIRYHDIYDLLRSALMSTVSTYLQPSDPRLKEAMLQSCELVYPYGRQSHGDPATSVHPGYTALLRYLTQRGAEGQLRTYFEQPPPGPRRQLTPSRRQREPRFSVYSHGAELPLLPIDILAQPGLPGPAANRLVPAADSLYPETEDQVVATYLRRQKGLHMQLTVWGDYVEQLIGQDRPELDSLSADDSASTGVPDYGGSSDSS